MAETLYELALDVQSKGVKEAHTALQGIEASGKRVAVASKAQQVEITKSTALLQQMASVVNKSDRATVAGLQRLASEQKKWAMEVGATTQQLLKLQSIENRLAASGASANNWAGKLRGGLVSLTTQIAGTNPVVSQLAGTVGMLALGPLGAAGVLAGLAALAFGYNKLTSSAREAQKEIDDLGKSLLAQAKAEHLATTQGKRESFQKEIGVLKDAQAALDRFNKTGGKGPLGLGAELESKLLKNLNNATIQATQAAKNLKEAKAAEAAQILANAKATDRSTSAIRANTKAAKENTLPHIKGVDFGGLSQFEKGGDFVSDEIGGGVPDWMTKAFGDENTRKQAFKDYEAKIKAEFDAMGERISQTISSGFAQTLGDAIYNAFSAAFSGEGIGGAIKAFGKTILAGLGSIFAQMGQTYIEYGILMTGLGQLLWNPFTSGPAAIAIGVALMALSGVLGAVAHGGGGRGTAQAGAFRERPNGTAELTRIKFVDSRTGASMNLQPKSNFNVTIIGPNDSSAQRAMKELIANAGRRVA